MPLYLIFGEIFNKILWNVNSSLNFKYSHVYMYLVDWFLLDMKSLFDMYYRLGNVSIFLSIVMNTTSFNGCNDLNISILPSSK